MAIQGDLTEERLLELYVQAWSESQTLEFKRDLPGKSDRDKAEFLKDVCALANSDGGDLLYGVDEADGKAKDLKPINDEPADATARRLLQVIDAGIEPRIVGLWIRNVPVAGGYILHIKVPASFNGPHRYAVNGPGRFVMRDGTHTREFSYGELRAAFDRTATLAERARRFREQRLIAIGNRQTWRPVRQGPVCVLQLIPLAAMAGNRSVDIANLHNNYTSFTLPEWGGASRSTNLDGLIVHPGGRDDKEMAAYVQVFRSGSIEAVRFGGRTVDDKKLIPSRPVSVFFRSAVSASLAAVRSLGFEGPAVVGAAMLTVSGYALGLSPEHFDTRAPVQSDLVLPEAWLDDAASADVDEVTRSELDIFWQAFGVERCYDYTLEGKWLEERRW